MKTSPSPHAPLNLSPQLYYQLTYTLTDLLPPPLDDSPDALRARNHAAIAKVAAMRPVNANEADLAAQCIVARAQAEDIMRLIRENRHDIKLVTRLNAQYVSMARMSMATHKHLMQVQAVRQKREAIEAAATQDARTRHIVERSMLRVADPEFERLQASPPAPPGKAPEAAPVPRADPTTVENVSKNNTNSHTMAFETRMSDLAWDEEAEERELREHIRETQRQALLAMQEWSAKNGRASPSGSSNMSALDGSDAVNQTGPRPGYQP
jgi:hypothetical protein